MAYSKFTEQKVFADPNINILCNRIYENLTNNFEGKVLSSEFCITGSVARIIQGDALSLIEVIPFITKDVAIYNFCKSSLPKLIGASATTLKDRIQLNYKGVFLEIWFTIAIGTINSVTGLAVQDSADIPLNIK